MKNEEAIIDIYKSFSGKVIFMNFHDFYQPLIKLGKGGFGAVKN